MAFGTDANKKPSEIDPKDYIPRVPEALRQKFSKDPQNISSQSENSVIDSPVKINKSRSNRSLKNSKGNNTRVEEKENENAISNKSLKQNDSLGKLIFLS
jgi:hypothetical protein